MTSQPATETIKNTRLDDVFARLATAKKPALISYIMGGDPNAEISVELMKTLATAGSDVIELGMPFSDPTADGPTIQRAGIRALKNGATITTVFEQLYEFRQSNTETPVILMGYFNPILHYGIENFCADAESAGADGLIIVDLPPEESAELEPFANAKNLHLIRLLAPTTNDERLDYVLDNASGFVYFVSMTGTTGTKSINPSTVVPHLTRLRKHTKLPIAVGFGIKTPEQAEEIGKFADAVVVGSAIVDLVGKSADSLNTMDNANLKHKITADVFEFVASLAKKLKVITRLK